MWTQVQIYANTSLLIFPLLDGGINRGEETDGGLSVRGESQTTRHEPSTSSDASLAKREKARKKRRVKKNNSRGGRRTT
jgi:hypothetical protein